MKQSLLLSVLLAATLNLTGGSIGSPSNSSFSPPDDVQVINVTAKKYEFDPSPIRVKQGTRVQLKITATDHAHGFSIQEVAEGASSGKPGLVFSSARGCVKIEEGQSATIELSRKHQEPTRSAAAFTMAGATEE